MSVGRICSRVVVTASPDESVLAVARRMKEHNVGTVVVVSEASKPLAIVTDRDVVMRCVAPELSMKDTPVSVIMTREVKTIDEATPIEQALRTMAISGTRRLVVTGELGVLRGVLSLDDVVELMTEEAESIGKLLQQASAHLVTAS
jgi:CBS domain-containing protein